MELTEDEVLQILKLIEESSFDELHLEMGDLKLTVSKGGHISTTHDELLKAPIESVDFKGKKSVETSQTESKTQKAESEATTVIEEGLLTIKAPMLGTFYECPEPGAAPYVDVGTFVKEDDTVALIEIMKVFTTLKAGVEGYITEICAESGQLVEYGQILFLARPKESPEEKIV